MSCHDCWTTHSLLKVQQACWDNLQWHSEADTQTRTLAADLLFPLTKSRPTE